MRIFPEGAREWLKPVGQVFVIVAAGMLLFGLAVFAWKTWILNRWPRTEGVIVNARVETSTSGEDDVRTCSAVYTVQYSAKNKDFTTVTGGHSFTSDCSQVEAEVRTAAGRRVIALYDRDNPRGAYVNPGLNTEFYLIPFILLIMSIGFSIIGFGAWTLGAWLDRIRFELP